MEIIFTDPKKDRHRDRLGSCQSCSCFSTSSASQSLYPANSHPNSSSVCIFQSTPAALCLDPGFLRNEFRSQTAGSCAPSAFLFCWAHSSPVFPGLPCRRERPRGWCGHKWCLLLPCLAPRPPRYGQSKGALTMEPACKGYCPGSATMNICLFSDEQLVRMSECQGRRVGFCLGQNFVPDIPSSGIAAVATSPSLPKLCEPTSVWYS